MSTTTDHGDVGRRIQVTCPAPHAEHERVLLGHGSGGQLSAQLLHELIVPALGPAAAGICLDDAAVLDLGTVGRATAGYGEGRAVLTTDSFVVDPLEFPGGDIGALAVNGTINDLAMRGAAEDTSGRRCLCNGLLATIGLGQRRRDGYREPPVVTLGQQLDFLPHLLPTGASGYSAAQVIDYLLER